MTGPVGGPDEPLRIGVLTAVLPGPNSPYEPDLYRELRGAGSSARATISPTEAGT